MKQKTVKKLRKLTIWETKRQWRQIKELWTMTPWNLRKFAEDDNARTATYRANPELAELCVWCGKSYEEHRNEPLPSGAVPKMPCKGLKQYFVKNDKK